MKEMSRGKGFGEKKLLIKSNFSTKSHPLNKFAREGADRRALIRFIEENWERLSGEAWKGYLEQGRGALIIKLDKMVLLGAVFSVQYIDEREIFRREMMRGLWAAMQADKVQKIVNEYDPERQVAIILEWRGRDGHISLRYNSTSSTPAENYQKLGLQAEEPASPLNKLLDLRASVEWADPLNPPHPICRLIAEDFELFAAFAWKGYLEQGRGAVHILLGKGGWEASGIQSWNSGEFPFKYLGEHRYDSSLSLKQTEDRKNWQELISKYDPSQEFVLVVGWTCSKGLISLSLKTNDKDIPPECYKRLKGQLDEFTVKQSKPTFPIPKKKTISIFEELVEYRERLTLPTAGSETDKSTIAKLEIGSQTFFGINSGSNPNPRQITFRVNPITKTHAEADAFQQAADAGIKGGKARLIVDRDLCAACGIRGGVNSMAWQLGIEELEIITPSESKTITVKPPNRRSQ
jgi:hypothetical protein